jgi:hypothetical protein
MDEGISHARGGHQNTANDEVFPLMNVCQSDFMGCSACKQLSISSSLQLSSVAQSGLIFVPFPQTYKVLHRHGVVAIRRAY